MLQLDSGTGSIVSYLLQATSVTLKHIFILFGPGLILAVIMYCISELLIEKSVSFFGITFWIYFSALGVMIHEIGHAIFAVIFGHRVTDVTLFRPDPETGTPGSISHAYNKRNIYQVVGNFFIGIGPIIFGTTVIFLSAKLFIGNEFCLPIQGVMIDSKIFGSLEDIWALVKNVSFGAIDMFSVLFGRTNLTNWRFYVFLYLAMVFSILMSLLFIFLVSAADMVRTGLTRRAT